MKEEKLKIYSLIHNVLAAIILMYSAVILLTEGDFNLLIHALIWIGVLTLTSHMEFDIEGMLISIMGIFTVASAVLFPWAYVVWIAFTSNIIFYLIHYISEYKSGNFSFKLNKSIYYISDTIITSSCVSVIANIILPNRPLNFQANIWSILLVLCIDVIVCLFTYILFIIESGDVKPTLKSITEWCISHFKSFYDIHCINIPTEAILIIMFTYFGYGGLLLASSFALILHTAFRRFSQVKKIEEDSCTDTLSQVKNRKYYAEKLPDIIPDGASIVFVDVNGLKKVNDEYGHDFGDEYIVKASSILSRAVDSKDIIMRFGGDEFVVYVEDGSMDKCIEIVKAIEEMCVNEPLKLSDGTDYNVSMSIGIAQCPIDGTEKDILSKVADDRMYSNKHGDSTKLIRQSLYES